MQKNKKQSKEKIKSQELLKNKEKFMNLKGYKIKVGEDTFILFEKEDIYLVLFYIEKSVSIFIIICLMKKKESDYFLDCLSCKYILNLLEK